MTTTPKIPDAAVEAAARAIDPSGWRLRDSSALPVGHEGRDAVVRRSRDEASSALTAAWKHLHPTITTAEELDALPMGSVVIEDGGEVMIKNTAAWFCGCCREDGFPSEDINLPATVLYRGDAQ